MTPTILALDTATDACSVAIAHDGLITEDFRIAPQQHAAIMLPMIEAHLQQRALTLSAIDVLAFGCGPGSFTGLRIASSIIQGLATAIDKPIVAISDCQALAQWAFRQHGHEHVLSVIDARMQEVYWGIYRATAGVMCATTHDSVGPVTHITVEQSVAAAVGNGVPLLTTTYAYNYAEALPRAYDIALLAGTVPKSDYLTAAEAQPIYLRNDVTQQHRK